MSQFNKAANQTRAMQSNMQTGQGRQSKVGRSQAGARTGAGAVTHVHGYRARKTSRLPFWVCLYSGGVTTGQFLPQPVPVVNRNSNLQTASWNSILAQPFSFLPQRFTTAIQFRLPQPFSFLPQRFTTAIQFRLPQPFSFLPQRFTTAIQFSLPQPFSFLPQRFTTAI